MVIGFKRKCSVCRVFFSPSHSEQIRCGVCRKKLSLFPSKETNDVYHRIRRDMDAEAVLVAAEFDDSEAV